MTYTREQINEILRTNDRAVERAIIRLFELQNSDEQQWGTASEKNGRGFCSSDARAGTRFARWIQGMDNKNVKRYDPKSLSNPRAMGIFGKYCQEGGTVMDRARKIALKHSAQLVTIANEKANKRQAMRETVTPVGEPKKAQWQMTEPGGNQTIHIPKDPPAGTWAATARIMSQGDDSGFDWDAWKDEMKDRSLGGY